MVVGCIKKRAQGVCRSRMLIGYGTRAVVPLLYVFTVPMILYIYIYIYIYM